MNKAQHSISVLSVLIQLIDHHTWKGTWWLTQENGHLNVLSVIIDVTKKKTLKNTCLSIWIRLDIEIRFLYIYLSFYFFQLALWKNESFSIRPNKTDCKVFISVVKQNYCAIFQKILVIMTWCFLVKQCFSYIALFKFYWHNIVNILFSFSCYLIYAYLFCYSHILK